MDWLFWLGIVRWTIRIAMVPVIIRRRFPPSTAIAWLAVIFLEPLIGVLLYGLLGSQVLGRKRRIRYRQNVWGRRAGAHSQSPQPAQIDGLLPHHHDRLDPIMTQTKRVFGMPCTYGNEVRFLAEHKAFVQSIIDDIDAAQHHVHMLFYIYEPDETGQTIADALVRAADRGVVCRVLADAAGSMPFFKRRGLASQLVQAGVMVQPALPASLFRKQLARIDLRNHRKLIVVDGSVGYVGSHNIINEAYPSRPPLQCHDLSARFRGPVVNQLQAVFAEDWTFDTDERLSGGDIFPANEPAGEVAVQTVPSGPEAETKTLRRILLTAIAAARHRLVLTTPYFVPDEYTILALSMAAHRGVQVHVIVSESSDYGIVTAAGRAQYQPLMEYGVRIHLFPHGLLHAKSLTIDEHFGIVGSANIDSRSFILNFELNTLMYGPEITNRLLALQEQYIQQCYEISLDEWVNRPLWRQFVDDAASLLSPLL